MTKYTCKTIATFMSLVLLAACGAPQPGADANMRNGMYKTSGGVPWMVTTSGQRPLSEANAMRASAETNINLTSRGSINVTNGKAKSQFRIVTIDGYTFGTIGEVRMRGASKSQSDQKKNAVQLLMIGIGMAGCRPRGTDYGLLSKNNGPIVAAATGADC